MQDRRDGLTRRNVSDRGGDDRDGDRATPSRRLSRAVAALDANPKLKEDYAGGDSVSGAITTLACGVLCLFLFFGEYFAYRTTSIASELRVDKHGINKHVANAERMKIDIDITFHSMACDLIALDTSDKAGEQHYDVHDGHIKKRRLDRNGKVLSTEFSTEAPNRRQEIATAVKMLNETETASSQLEQKRPAQLQLFGGFNDLLKEYFPNGIEAAFENKDQEGCEVKGYLEVNRVPGSFVISPGRSLSLGLQMVKLNVHTNLNLTHTIHRLSFGEGFPGIVSPLDGTQRSIPANSVQQYFLTVVPTTYTPLNSKVKISTNQYSVTESYSKARPNALGLVSNKQAGVFFEYDLSAIRVDFKETRSSFGAFLTGICAIIGGVVTIAGVVQRGIEYFLAHQRKLIIAPK